MISENSDSARARLIKTRRGPKIDEGLLPAARQECLDILRKAAREAVGEGTYIPGWISDVSKTVDDKINQAPYLRFYILLYELQQLRHAPQADQEVENALMEEPEPKGNSNRVTEKKVLDLLIDAIDEHGVRVSLHLVGQQTLA